ncbi:hypothetical protein B0I37DRAFT_375102 [Chaetomium sp. MPI-CAGE-AT-0009]|nr:hypothetical protein B0I37DRAFT_375102 [Chaetomium sp. MPI-CAGE-AT-0009]
MLWVDAVGALWLAMHCGGWATFGLLVTCWCQREKFLYLEIRLFPRLHSTGLWAPKTPSGGRHRQDPASTKPTVIRIRKARLRLRTRPPRSGRVRVEKAGRPALPSYQTKVETVAALVSSVRARDILCAHEKGKIK